MYTYFTYLNFRAKINIFKSMMGKIQIFKQNYSAKRKNKTFWRENSKFKKVSDMYNQIKKEFIFGMKVKINQNVTFFVDFETL